MSHPTMGAWIEILTQIAKKMNVSTSHPTMGAWIEILTPLFLIPSALVAPHDGCVDWNKGVIEQRNDVKQSHPTMGAWIEISILGNLITLCTKSHPTMGAWIEIALRFWQVRQLRLSHPTMGAWIEICLMKRHLITSFRRTPRWVRGLKYLVLPCFS